MAEPRRNPYIWAKWLTGILAAENHCEWSLWFRAHYKYDKIEAEGEEAFDLAAWNAQHGAMVRDKFATLKAAGYVVYVENQNKFFLDGKSATLSGVPDIVAVKDGEALVVDCKTGKQRQSHILQVLVYMYVLPIVHQACKGKTMTGLVQYTDSEVPIAATDLTDGMRKLIRTTIERAGGTEPTPKVPSLGECRWCDITKEDCPERVEPGAGATPVAHDLF